MDVSIRPQQALWEYERKWWNDSRAARPSELECFNFIWILKQYWKNVSKRGRDSMLCGIITDNLNSENKTLCKFFGYKRAVTIKISFVQICPQLFVDQLCERQESDFLCSFVDRAVVKVYAFRSQTFYRSRCRLKTRKWYAMTIYNQEWISLENIELVTYA